MWECERYVSFAADIIIMAKCSKWSIMVGSEPSNICWFDKIFVSSKEWHGSIMNLRKVADTQMCLQSTHLIGRRTC